MLQLTLTFGKNFWYRCEKTDLLENSFTSNYSIEHWLDIRPVFQASTDFCEWKVFKIVKIDTSALWAFQSFIENTGKGARQFLFSEVVKI